MTPTVFSTAGLPAARRVELWESHNATALIALDVHSVAPLDATELNVRLPQARLARVTGTAHAVARTDEVIARSPADSIAVYLTLRGNAAFTSSGGTLTRRAGDALVCATDAPFSRVFPHGLEELVVTVPYSALTARAPAPRLDTPVATAFAAFAAPPASPGPVASPASPGPVVPGEPNRYARALAKLAGRATRADHPLPADEGTILDLVAVLTAGQAAARLYIEENLTDPALGATQIAAAISLSERQLSRVFAADGTSVPRHILLRRLQLAHRLLSVLSGPTAGTGSPTATASIADVAARCGFTSVTYFSHAFHQHFGLRPTDIRRDPSAAQAPK